MLLTPRAKKGVLKIFLALLAIVFSTWQLYKYKFARRGIHAIVSKKSKGLYYLDYKHLFIDEIGGFLSADSVHISADTSVYNQMSIENRPSLLVNVFIPQFKVLHVATPRALLTKEISGEEIKIDSPLIEIGLNKFLKDTSDYSPGEEICKQILGSLKSIHIHRIEIVHAKLKILDLITGNTHFKADDVSITLSDILVDSAHEKDSSRILFSKNIDVSCREIALEGKAKKYKVHLEGLEFRSETRSFAIRGIYLVPTLSETAFAQAAQFQKDRLDFSFENLLLTGINQQSLLHKKIDVDKLIIGNSVFKIYRDLSYPKDSMLRPVRNFPQQQFMRLPFQLAIKKIFLQHSFIEYKEKNAKSHHAGKVQFYDVRAELTNVVNIQSLIAGDKICQLHFRSKFLNKTVVTAKIDFRLDNKDGRFFIIGRMLPVKATGLNVLTQPMALVKIKEGNFDGLDFRFGINNYETNGQVKFLYHGLKMELLKKDEDDSGYSNRFFSSFILNQVLRNSNPGNGQIKTEQVRYENLGRKSIFNMIWKPILQGVKQTVGIKHNENLVDFND